MPRSAHSSRTPPLPRMGALSLDRARLDAALFDLDGVLTRTDLLHRAAWKEAFDPVLAASAARSGESPRPFSAEDYLRHVDGRRRLDGVRELLRARGVALPAGEPGDPPGTATEHGVANRKNERFLALLRERGARPEPGARVLLRRLREAGFRTAVVSASRNCRAVLAAAGLDDLLDAVVDGVERARLGLPGKPAPDLFVEAARRLGPAPARTAVFEDSLPGVEAARAGGFALVVGVTGGRPPEDLRRAGAHEAIRDLGDVVVRRGGRA